jgi:hypothetical protein
MVETLLCASRNFWMGKLEAGVREELRGHVERDAAGECGDLGVRAEGVQEWDGEEYEHGHGVEDELGPLQLHAHHVQPPHAVRLPAARSPSLL